MFPTLSVSTWGHSRPEEGRSHGCPSPAKPPTVPSTSSEAQGLAGAGGAGWLLRGISPWCMGWGGMPLGVQPGSEPIALCPRQEEKQGYRQSSEIRIVLAGGGGGKSSSAREPFSFCLCLPGLSLLSIKWHATVRFIQQQTCAMAITTVTLGPHTAAPVCARPRRAQSPLFLAATGEAGTAGTPFYNCWGVPGAGPEAGNKPARVPAGAGRCEGLRRQKGGPGRYWVGSA